MITKSLNKTEVSKGFIQIPASARQKLIGGLSLPLNISLDGNPARLDKHGRIWAHHLRNRYTVGEEVIIDKRGNLYEIRVDNKAELPMVEVTEHERKENENSGFLPNPWHKVIEGDCTQYLNLSALGNIDLTFFDPPYNQGKSYRFFDDNQPDGKYWDWVQKILESVYEITQPGGAIYFMQREKNTEKVLRFLRETSWTFQNLIIWKKKTSAVPCGSRFSKQYQIIAYAIKGNTPRVFNKLRIDPPPLPEHKYKHENGVYLTDVWDDIREMTSGYFAGDEAIRDEHGNRAHTQQSPVSLLLRIILSSSLPGDVILDPAAGTGTALVVAKQLKRNSIGIEIDPANVALIKKRLNLVRPSDRISRYMDYYRFTKNLDTIWATTGASLEQKKLL